MNKFRSLADRQPLAFGFAVTFIFILLVLVSSIIANRIYPAGTLGWYMVSLVGRLVSIFTLLIVLSRLGWLQPAGFTPPGARRAWLLVLLPLSYAIAASAFAMTGNFDFGFSDKVLFIWVSLFLMVHAFLEETAFRGLILHDFVRAWGSTNGGLIRSVVISSLFYGGYHILYLASEPLTVVLWRILGTSLMGVLFGGFVLRGRSIYPAAFFHGAWNIAGYLNLTHNGMEGTAWSWMMLSLFTLPLAAYGLFLLRGLTPFCAHPSHGLGVESSAR